MSVELLSRIQFGLTVSFHFVFPPMTIGLGLILVILQWRRLRTGDPLYTRLARFWTKVFGLIFAMGVATGIPLEFQFGMNWASYARFVGDIFGSPLAIEGIYAFFLESGFLALLLFGWNRIGPRMHFVATCLVALGAHFSAIWILVANSWMQTPAGFHLARRMKETADGALHPLTADLGDAAARIVEVPLPVGHIVRPEELGQVRAVIDDFSAAILNPSTLERLAHTVLACWVVGAFLVAGVAAWWLLRGRFVAEAKASMRIALSVALVACLLQMLAGDVTARGVAERQPTKLAALEGLERSGSDAPLSIVGWVTWRRDDAGRIEGIETTSLRIPGLLSILVSGKYLDPAAGRATVVRGLADLPDDALLRARHPGLSDAELAAIRSDYWPAVPIVFQTYHLMIALGVGLSLLAIVATVLRWRGSLWRTDCRPVRAVLWCLVAAPIAAHVATQAGWFTAEMGRQPWIVYEVLKTGDAASAAVRPRQVATSIVVFTAIYALLTVLFVTIFVSKVRHGPAPSPGAADGESGPLSLRSSRSTAPEAPAATRAAPPAARPEDTPWT